MSKNADRVRECPRCWVPLKTRIDKVWGLVSVEVDECPKCDGIYLDDGELKKLTGNRSLAKWLTKYLGIDSDSGLICPRCGGMMDAERPEGIEVDVCLTCHGIWLDAGELEALSQLEDSQFKRSALSNEKLAELFDEEKAGKGSQKPFNLLGLFGLDSRRKRER